MKRIDLIPVQHGNKIGDICQYIEPNVTEDCIFYSEGEAIGFYLTKMPDKMCKLANLANAEFRSKNVPKSIMSRATVANKEQYDLMKKGLTEKTRVDQFSTIIGSIAPKAQFKRPYPNHSSVHKVQSANTFIKAMLMLATESEQLIKEILPHQHEKQLKLFEQVQKKWRFANLFTSSISNYNISAPYHRDVGNIVGAVNVIICKKHNSKGGDLNIPDYGATIGQQDNSILVYPAWKNLHGVTPIIPTHEGGYRNSLIFYPLKAFVGLD